MKLLRKIGLSLMIFVGVLAIAIAFFAYTLKPQYEGEKQIADLSEAVSIYYDDYGIPHIYGSKKKDAFRALGYIHAQDRLWQMELLRRIGGGGLSEIFGSTTLETDSFFLALGIDEASARTVAELDHNSEAVQLSLAYLDGINQFVENGPKPIEYYLTGLETSKFTLHDIQNVFGYMAFSFAQAHKTDPLLTKIRDNLGADYIADLGVPMNSGAVGSKHSKVFPRDTTQQKLTSTVMKTLDILNIPLFEGSNAWAIGAGKTKNGKVIFANDPHIGFAQPSVWFEAHIVTPTYEKYGYHLAGIPFPVLGHNRNLAYGMTMLENDDIDFYYEEVHPQDETKYKLNNEWVPFETKTHRIKVKDSQDVHLTLKKTKRGPVMSGIMKQLKQDRPISMWWAYTQNKNHIIEGLYEMTEATTLEAFEKTLSKIHAPGLTIMYGDAKGTIASWGTAKLYKIPDSVSTKIIQSKVEAFPSDKEYLPFSENPKTINPKSRYVYAANEQADTVMGTTYPGYYLPENRAKRIDALLQAKNDWDKEAVGKMMTDVTSAMNPTIVKNLAKGIDVKTLNAAHQELLGHLMAWQGRYSLESVDATLYHRWILFVLKYTFEDELGTADFDQFLTTHLSKRIVAPISANPNSVWWDDITTEVKENQSDIVQKAFAKALSSLEEDFGKDASQWTWGQVHTLEHEHPIGRAGGLLRSFFNVGPFPVTGTKEVINNLSFDYNGTGYFNVTVGPSTRRIIDFSDVENSISILPTGQSGNPFSKYYQNQAEMYVNGEFRKMKMNKAEILEKSDSKLVLTPK